MTKVKGACISFLNAMVDAMVDIIHNLLLLDSNNLLMQWMSDGAQHSNGE
jgi:hypothetical protein